MVWTVNPDALEAAALLEGSDVELTAEQFAELTAELSDTPPSAPPIDGGVEAYDYPNGDKTPHAGADAPSAATTTERKDNG